MTGAASNGEWVGVSLRDVLELAGIKPDAVSVLVDGTFSQIWKTLGPDRSERHQLLDIITVAICGVICGADSRVRVETLGRSKEEWFRTFLDLPDLAGLLSRGKPGGGQWGQTLSCPMTPFPG